MRLVIQRVRSAWVSVDGTEVARIGPGALLLLGIARSDTCREADWLAGKSARLRIFEDESGPINAPIQSVGGSFLVVSQFTLLASCRKGNRPSFIGAATPRPAAELYAYFCDRLHEESGQPVQQGRFREHMLVGLENDGPVTLVLEKSFASGTEHD